MPRSIIHLDLDAFYCSVEERSNPALRGKVFAVGGQPEQRGVISSCSYPARLKGVRSAMPTARALRLCPGMLVLHPDFKAYHAASQQVMDFLYQVTSVVEQISIDEAFLDTSDLPTDPEIIARQLQAKIMAELQLPCSLGIATNKLMAKIATDVGKASNRTGGPPNALLRVPAGKEAAFLAPLPVISLWGIGPKTSQHLNELGIHTIGDLAGWPENELARLFGKNGHDLFLHARGLDDRPLETSRETKSISREITYSQDVGDKKSLERTLREMAEDVSRRLKQEELSGSTIKLKLRWPDFTTLSRQVTLDAPTDQQEIIYQAACQLFEKTWQPPRKVRLIGIGVSGFEKPFRQLSLWEASGERQQRLQQALDELRQKYGEGIFRHLKS